MSISTENFIKGNYQISDEPGGKSSTSRLAVRLNISHAAVTDMAKKLSMRGWVMYQKDQEIKLTPGGETRFESDQETSLMGIFSTPCA